MFDKLKEFWDKVWAWIQALWAKHDQHLEEMVTALLPIVANLALRNDLTGEEKRKAVVDAILDNAEIAAEEIAVSMINEAVEVAANRYNIQLGKLTIGQMDNAAHAVLEAGRLFANNKLDITGEEAEKAGLTLPKTLSNDDL